MLGSLLTTWTIRLALACLAVYFAARLLGFGLRPCQTPRSERMFTTLRWIWTIGCVLFLAHVACAFQFTHHWSHDHAWKHTAAETERLMGFSFGDGIYFSYFFLVLWVVDVVALWVCVRPSWLILPTYLFLFFIALNGAIVFEDGPTRPVGIFVVAALVPLAVLFVVRHGRRLLSQERKEAQLANAAELET